MCAIGLITEVTGVSVDQDALDPDDPDDFEFQNAHEALGALVGLTDRQTWDVVGMNDGRPKGAPRLAFTEIADAVAGWFDKNGDPLPPPKKTWALPRLPPDQEERSRSAWIAALRREGHRQCAGLVWGHRVSAIALIVEAADMGWEEICYMLPDDTDDVDEADAYVDILGALIGLDQDQTAALVKLNDGTPGTPGLSFDKIADVVEGWVRVA